MRFTRDPKRHETFVRTNGTKVFFFLKHTFSKFLVNNEILTIISKRGHFSRKGKENRIVFIRISILSFTFILLIVVDRFILKNTRNA